MTNIKTFTRAFALVALAVCLALTGSAQTTVTSTTLSSAIDANQTVFAIASATGVSNANGTNYITYLYVDRELMGVASLSSTTVTVQRGLQGRQTAHKSSAKVWVGPPGAFQAQDPSGAACTAANQAYLPYINVANGNLWNCGNGQWTTFGDYDSRMTVGAQLTTAATIAPTNPIHHLTGTTSISTITVPPALAATGGCIIIIPDQVSTTTTTSGNIGLVSVLVVNKNLTLCYDPGSAKWTPSY